MKGTRPLTKHEIHRVLESFRGRLRLRNRALFLLGVTCGFRIQELISLRVQDVITEGVIVDRVTVEKRNTKGCIESRSVKLLEVARNGLLDWITKGLWQRGYVSPATYLFRSEYGLNNPISPRHALRVLTRNYEQNRLAGKLGTHSMRKTYAKLMYGDLVERRARGEAVDPLPITSKGLGHKTLTSTMSYLSFLTEDVDTSAANVERKIFGAP